MSGTAPTYHAMRMNEQLIRRARLRKAINSRSGPNGFSTVKEIADHIGSTPAITNQDLSAIGAVKVQDTIDGKRHEWWIIPAYNPLLPNLRDYMSETALLNEISLKIRAHVLEMFCFKEEIIVKTERSAGPLLADWISLLPWREIIHVTEQRSGCVIRCIDAGVAQDVLSRLLGESEDREK